MNIYICNITPVLINFWKREKKWSRLVRNNILRQPPKGAWTRKLIAVSSRKWFWKKWRFSINAYEEWARKNSKAIRRKNTRYRSGVTNRDLSLNICLYRWSCYFWFLHWLYLFFYLLCKNITALLYFILCLEGFYSAAGCWQWIHIIHTKFHGESMNMCKIKFQMTGD